MKPGDPVRVTVAPRRRKLRGVVVAVDGDRVTVAGDRWPVEVDRAAVQVIRRPAERLLVLARDRARRAEIAALVRDRVNKTLPGGKR